MTKTIEDCIIHWQKKLNRNPDDDVILNVIGKLSKLPITRELLEATEIAKCIKLVSKRDDLVGKEARVLVSKWKDIFRNSASHRKSSSSKDKIVNNVNHSLSKQNVSQEKNDRHHKASNHEHKHKHKKRSEIHLSPEQSPDKYSKENCNGTRDSSHSSYNLDKFNSYDPVASVSNGYDPDYPEFNSSDKSSYDPQDPQLSPSEIDLIKKKLESNNAYKPSPLKRNHEEGEHSVDKTVAKRSKTSSNSGYENTTEYRKHEGKKDKHSSSKIKDNSLSSSHKESHENKESEKRTLEDKKSKHISKKEKEKLHSDSKNNYCDEKKSEDRKVEKHKSSSDVKKHKSKKSSNSEGKKSNKSKPAVKLLTSEEFTSSNNVSFEDILGFNDIVPLKKKNPNKVSSTHKVPAAKSENTKVKPSKKVNNDSPYKEEVSEIVDHYHRLEVPPKPPKMDMSDITSALPELEMNYDLPLFDFISPKKKIMSNEEAIKFTSSRREKTAVYSGKKSYYTEVPTLTDFCIRVLIDNIDAIDYMPGVPYYLLKPVLERCSPAQLCIIEDYNPDLIDSTNELWEIHCKRDYKLLKPQEHETWRELYLRARDEQEKRLKSVTANICKSMHKATPVRKAILAYVDSVAKPPRDVARRQAKHGTAASESQTPKSGMSPKPTTTAITKLTTPTITKPTTSHQSPTRNTSSSTVTVPSIQSSVKQKPKVAPLMAKALKSMKQCFRRK